MQDKDVYSYIKNEEETFRSTPIEVIDGYSWNMYEHIRKSTLYKNSVFVSGQTDTKPFRNIVIPIVNLQYRATGFDVKDIELYVDQIRNYYKSFLVRKAHDRWAVEEEIDTFIDEVVESYVDFGGTLIKNLKGEVKPEVVPLQRLAFCDQTDLLGGSICERHFFTPPFLMEMVKKGWDKDVVETAIKNSQKTKRSTNYKDSQVPNNQIEVYELHGILPISFLEPENKEIEFTRQVQIVTFYRNDENKVIGSTFFKGREKESIYDGILRDPIFGRALGRGGIEELFQPQIWNNYSAIRLKEMLDAAAKIIFQTADKRFHAMNNLERVDNNEILIHEPGKPLTQVNTTAVNANLFDNAMADWESHGRIIGSASDPVLGETPKSGTPFRLQALVTAQGLSLHEYRKGKIATFLDRVWRKTVIPGLVKDLSKGKEFLATLDLDELEEITERVVTNQANKMVKDRILSGGLILPGEVDEFKEKVRQDFRKGGTKRFLKILKDEFKDTPLAVRISIVGKQSNLPQITEKLSNVFAQIIANPAILQNKTTRKIFDKILETSGLSPLDFADLSSPSGQVPPQPIPQATRQPAPLTLQ